MKESNKRMLSLLAAFVLFLVSLFIFSSFVKPTFLEVRDLREQLKTERDRLNAQKNASTAMDNFYADYNKNAASIKSLLETALPGGKDVPQSVFQVQSLSYASGLKLRSFSVELANVASGGEKAGASLIKKVEKIEMDVKLSGKYESFKNFLKALETNVKLTDVKSIDISTATGGDLVFGLKLNAYYQE